MVFRALSTLKCNRSATTNFYYLPENKVFASTSHFGSPCANSRSRLVFARSSESLRTFPP
jgi:hypothetical protein